MKNKKAWGVFETFALVLHTHGLLLAADLHNNLGVRLLSKSCLAKLRKGVGQGFDDFLNLGRCRRTMQTLRSARHHLIITDEIRGKHVCGDRLVRDLRKEPPYTLLSLNSVAAPASLAEPRVFGLPSQRP